MEQGSNNQSAPVRPNGEDEQSRQDGIQGKSDDKPMSVPSGELSGLKLVTMTVGLGLALFLVTLDTNIIAIAIPKITDEFHSINDIGWYGSVYLLTACTFQLVFGKLYSLFSTKLLYIAAIILFEVGSIVCAAAPNSTALIIGRAVAGFGCAGILAGTFTIIAIIVPPHRRPAYSGIVGAVYSISSVAGPLLGGVFTDKVTWRWCFWINLPIGAVALLFTILTFHSTGVDNKDATFIERVKRVDPIGVPLLIIAVVCLLLALQWGGAVYRWNDPKVFMLIVIFGILSIAFMWLQARQGADATLPISVVTQRSVVGASLFAFASGATSFMIWQYVPIWFQAIQGVSPVQAGIRSIAMILATAISSIVAGAGTTATGYISPFLIASSVLMAVGAGLLTTWNAGTPESQWIGYQVVFGIGSGMCMQTPIMVVQTVLPMAQIPQGSALIMFLQTFGGSIFISVAQNIFINRLQEGLAADFPGVDVGAVVNGGATSIRDQGILPEGSQGAVLELYNIALTHSWYLAIALASLSLFGALAVEWRKIKKGEKKTEAAEESIQSDGAAGEEALTEKSAEAAKTA